MKKEEKKTETETQKVFIENLPKQRPLWKEYSLIIALFALFISIYSAYLTRKEYVASHRPYIYAASRISDNGEMDLNTVIVNVLNAPAIIINKEIRYISVSTKENGEDHQETKFNKIFDLESTLYPSFTVTSQITTLFDFKKEILEKDPNVKLKRKVRIEYKEFSTNRAYFFEGYWDYNRAYNVWQNNNTVGN